MTRTEKRLLNILLMMILLFAALFFLLTEVPVEWLDRIGRFLSGSQ